MPPRRATVPDRLSLTALAIADAGVGLFLIGVGAVPQVSSVHAVVGVVALVLAVPALISVIWGTLPPLADEGVLVNVGVFAFVSLQILLLPAQMQQRIGLAVLMAAVTLATVGLYLRLFGVLHLLGRRRRGRQ